ncbi:MAG: phosphatidylinositol kinase [Comamonadaceae bacterium CG1_02_60_18]|nr:MAG: phosphatidylinositol kinase [Comamonadaceae bacterium CG1_02_60_18]PIQ54811.1 MAG: phosphatidylinositol kinase [Comamonadaceae bacterium CG12_big_fil_rev_8_21_14_0_65_59_15]
MTPGCTIQLFCNGIWHDVATVALWGAEGDGWQARTYCGYAVDWAVNFPGARDAHALSCQFAVGLEPLSLTHWPVFLIDMLPQGFGREEILRRINLPVTAAEGVDWRLLQAGAGNPIGNLRVKEAAEWLSHNTGAVRGFTDDEVASRGEDFTEFLAGHGLFVAGSSGVQGEWPKLLLTRAQDGLLYLDHTLADAQAAEHYIVKFGRGNNPTLANILRHEAPYMALARQLGLRVHAALVLKQRALFIRRFDRVVQSGGVTRLAQESIACLTGMPGFGAVPSHDRVCRELMTRCTHPEAEVLEYIKRDVANLALGNKDNHARNTALQRDFDGVVRLTPLYDFAPMLLHPDGIARRIRWVDNDAGSPDWGRVVSRVCDISAQVQPKVRGKHRKSVPLVRREVLVAGLKAMVPALREIAQSGDQMGLDSALLAHLRAGILLQAQRLSDLK